MSFVITSNATRSGSQLGSKMKRRSDALQEMTVSLRKEKSCDYYVNNRGDKPPPPKIRKTHHNESVGVGGFNAQPVYGGAVNNNGGGTT